MDRNAVDDVGAKEPMSIFIALTPYGVVSERRDHLDVAAFCAQEFA